MKVELRKRQKGRNTPLEKSKKRTENIRERLQIYIKENENMEGSVILMERNKSKDVENLICLYRKSNYFELVRFSHSQKIKNKFQLLFFKMCC